MGNDMIRDTEQQRQANGAIKRNILFSFDLSADEIEHIESVMIRRRFYKDQIVLAERDTLTYMYFVYSGKIRIVKLSDDKKEQIITIHKKGDFFGEISFHDGETAPATIIAHEDSLIGLLHKKDFENYLLNHDGIRQKIIDTLCLRLRDAWEMIKILSFENAEHRVMVALDHLQQLYGVRDDRGVIINLKVTHQLIASYASVSRETVTRTLSKLEKSGEIATLENKSYLLRESFFSIIKDILLFI